MNRTRHSGFRRNPVTDHLDLWTSALMVKSTAGRGNNGRLEAYGIKRLRELILELAVRGKLVPQDINDESADKLLKKIAQQNANPISKGKSKQVGRVSEVLEEDRPYGLPANWQWARLPDVASYKVGKTPSTKNPIFWSEDDSDIPWVSISDMKHYGVLDATEKRVTKKAALDVFGYAPISKGSLLMSFKLTVGKIAVLGVDAYHNEAIISLQPNSAIEKDFLFKVLPLRAQKGNTKSAIMGNTLNSSSLSLLLIPVPPLAEQHRIVAKVDELMALCDQLERQQGRGIEAHQTLVETLLGTLTRVESAQEFAVAWSRIAEHFDALFTTDHSIDQLKQTILQLAVMGKLAPQKPGDESAAVLLQRIAAERSRLVETGEVAKSKPLPPVADEEKWFDLPATWSWARLDDLALHSEAGWSPSCESTPRRGNGWGVLKVSAVTWGKFDPTENKALPANLEPRPDFEVKAGDFLISRANTAELVARAVVVPDNAPPRLMMSDKIIRFVFSSEISREYLSLVNASEHSREYYARVAGGTSGSMKNVSREQIRNLVIALPPLAEQHRIVSKVDELMALCDVLKARLAEAHVTQIRLADAIVERAVG